MSRTRCGFRVLETRFTFSSQLPGTHAPRLPAAGVVDLSLLGPHHPRRVVLAWCDCPTRANLRLVSRPNVGQVASRRRRATWRMAAAPPSRWRWRARQRSPEPAGHAAARAAARPVPALATLLQVLKLWAVSCTAARLAVLLSVPWPRLTWPESARPAGSLLAYVRAAGPGAAWRSLTGAGGVRYRSR